MIIRPALLYGGPSALWSLRLGPINAAATLSASSELPIAANAHARLGLVHVDDVVSGVHLATNKHAFVSTASGSYPIFDVSSSSELLISILDEAATVLGYRGRLVYEGSGKDKFAEAMNTGMKEVQLVCATCWAGFQSTRAWERRLRCLSTLGRHIS